MIPENMELIVLLILAMITGALVGASAMNQHNQKKAIQHNAAYYHPQTGEFTWHKTVIAGEDDD